MARSLQTTYRHLMLGMVAANPSTTALPWLPLFGRLADHLAQWPPQPLPMALMAEGRTLMANDPVNGLLALVPWQLVQITAQPAAAAPAWSDWPSQGALDGLFLCLCRGGFGGRHALLTTALPTLHGWDPGGEALALAHHGLVMAQGDYTLAVQSCRASGPRALAGLLGGACGSSMPLPWQLRAARRLAGLGVAGLGTDERGANENEIDIHASPPNPIHRWGDGLLRHWAGAAEIQPWSGG